MSVAVVLFAVFAMTVANVTVYATLGLFGRSVGLSEVQVGAIFAASGLLFFLTASHWGRVADRHGRRPVIVGGLGGTAASLLLFAGLFALQPGDAGPAVLFTALLAARVLYGLTAGGMQPATTAHVVEAVDPGRRSTGAAWVGAAVALGSIVGPMSAALLIPLGFPAPPLLGGALALLAAGVALIGVGGNPRGHKARQARARPLETRWAHLVLAFLFYFGFAALQPTTAFFVQDLFKIDTTLAVGQAGLISATFAGCAFVVQALAVWRLALAPLKLLAIGIAICLVGIASCLMASDFAALLLAFGAVGVGYGLAQPGLMAWALLAADGERQAEIAGQVQAAMSAAWIAGPLVGAAVYAVDLKGALVLAALALGLALSILLMRGLRDATPPPAPSAPRA